MSIYDKLKNVKTEDWICEYKDEVLRRKYVSYKSINGFPKVLGYEYYPDGTVKFAGILQRGGLYEGKYYYPSGSLKFEGRCNERENGGYYGPSFPINGEYYSETGELLYQGRFKIERLGSLGYPKVVFPEGFKL